LFSINPPVVVFSPSRRGSNNSTKHSLQNMLELPEVAINIVDYDMVQQTSLSSCEFPKGVNEFIKAGFTEQPSTLIKPPMVRESKVKMECKVIEIKPLGDQAGAGNLVICEVLRMHIDDTILDDKKMIDQRKIHQVARLGGNWYSTINDQSLFQVEKPNTRLGIGVDALPPQVRGSNILTGNNLGMLANVQVLPVIDPAFEDGRLRQIFQYYAVNPTEMDRELQVYAKELLDKGKVKEAWQVLLTLN
jgi:flavin reductase (DIM6/NTAB) family NADH-FMN oxidoreductase RutF